MHCGYILFMCNYKTTLKMTRPILFLLILTLGLSCSSGRQEGRVETKAKEDIRFDFSAGRTNTFQESIEVNATLFNDSADTIYFLSSSCDGEQYSLLYDTAKFELTPYLYCNVTYPAIMKIEPKGKHDFQAHFRCSSTETKIKLGFDFFSVDKSFDLTDKCIGDITIFDRQKDLQKLIWADEKSIEEHPQETPPKSKWQIGD